MIFRLTGRDSSGWGWGVDCAWSVACFPGSAHNARIPFQWICDPPQCIYAHMWSRICVSGNDCLFVCLRYACVHRPGSCWFYTQLRIHRAFLFELLFSLKIPFSSPSYSSKLPPYGLLLKLDSNNKMVIALLEEVLKGCSLQLAYWPDFPKSPFINDKWLSRWRDVDWTQKAIWTATQSRWVCGFFTFKKCHNKEWTLKKLY